MPACPATHSQSAVIFQEGVTALLGGGKLPASGLCGRTFVVQFAARNGAGYSTVATSAANFTMPDCPGAGKAAVAEGVNAVLDLINIQNGCLHFSVMATFS